MLEAPTPVQKPKQPGAAPPKKAAPKAALKPVPRQSAKPVARTARPAVKPVAKPAVKPPEVRGLLGALGQKFGALGQGLKTLGATQLTRLREGSAKMMGEVGQFVRNPGKYAGSKLKDAGQLIGKKVNDFKRWYNTPEGKAKFYKGLALTVVGVATIASGGALTAPAIAVAAGISAAGGIAAQGVENAVFNAAAKQKASKDKTYKYKQRGLLEGVTAKSVLVDAAVGGLGGPIAKFAGKALIGSAVALGKGAAPAMRGVGRLGLAGAKGVARRVTPQFVKNGIKATGRGLSKAAGAVGEKVMQPTAAFLKRLPAGARKLASNAGDRLGQWTKAPREALAKQTRPLREGMANGAKKVAGYLGDKAQGAQTFVKSTVGKLRRWDRKQLVRVSKAVRNNPVVRSVKQGHAWLDGKANALSKGVTGLRNRAASGLDALAEKTGGKLGQTRVAQAARNWKEGVSKRVQATIEANPHGDVSKALVEFRTSGRAIQAHLNKVWGEASKDLNKDMGRLLGRYGSVQADFKALAEKGNKELYEQEFNKAKQLMTDRLRQKVLKDAEAAELTKAVRTGVPITDELRQQTKATAMTMVKDVMDKSAQKLERQAEIFVSRNPERQLEQAALKVQGIESAKKVAEKYFGKNAQHKGLIERSGMALSQPIRKPINEMVEKWTKIADAAKSGTPLASVTLVGAEGASESLSTQLEDKANSVFEDWGSKLKGTPEKPKKATEEEGSEVQQMLHKTVEDVAPLPPGIDDYQESLFKSLNFKASDVEGEEAK